MSKVDTEFIDDQEYVVQVGAGGQFEIFTVNCDEQESNAVAKLEKGQEITVLGDCEDGGELGVELENCVIQ